MSRFFSEKYAALKPYVPGEQPTGRKFIKLNTNESPFPPSPKVVEYAKTEAGRLNLYSDPDSRALTETVAAFYGLAPDRVIMTNGSDEVLNFAFIAFGDQDHPFVFPDVTYSFYEVFCALDQVPFETVPVRDDFSIDYRAYCGIGKNVILANPNAPSGFALPLAEIEEIVRTNPDNVVVIDEAYIDFGGESALALVPKYGNLLVTRTFSKSRSLAGARLGFGMAQPALIADLNTIKFSTNPYNVNRMTAGAGIAAMEENEYYMKNVRTICAVRDETAKRLRDMGCVAPDSHTNFLFVEVPGMTGQALKQALMDRGILVRQWDRPRIENRCRVTVGTQEEMDAFVRAVEELL